MTTPQNEVFIAEQFVRVTLRERHVGSPSMSMAELSDKAQRRKLNIAYATIEQAVTKLVEEGKVARVKFPLESVARVQATPMDSTDESQSVIDWMSEYWLELQKQYGGMWVAIKDFEVKLAAKNAKQLKKLLDEHREIDCPLIQQINKPSKKHNWFTAF
jgi:hypothetical protein